MKILAQESTTPQQAQAQLSSTKMGHTNEEKAIINRELRIHFLCQEMKTCKAKYKAMLKEHEQLVQQRSRAPTKVDESELEWVEPYLLPPSRLSSHQEDRDASLDQLLLNPKNDYS